MWLTVKHVQNEHSMEAKPNFADLYWYLAFLGWYIDNYIYITSDFHIL
jgi:hypothetical protein